MAYVNCNPKSTAELKRRFAAGEELQVFQPGGLFPLAVGPEGGKVYLEGPHYPKPHSWYCAAMVDANHIITEILK